MPASQTVLRNRLALITGASRGIGLAIARALAAEGCDLTLTSRNEAALKKASRELARTERRVLAKTCDVSNLASVQQLFAAVKKQFGCLDILINNAGISHAMAPVHELDPKVWQEVLATDLTGMFLCTRAALPLMRKGSTIVNNLSIAAKTIFPGQAAYCAAKHGALGLTNTLREELRPRGIRVIALLPGATDTDIWNQFWRRAPRGKMLRPETVAEAVVGALLLPPETTVEELILVPTAGKL
jgi:NAD(P)-dependent dehydrogenase (short-subunit alcohol dehydrogenase family)